MSLLKMFKNTDKDVDNIPEELDERKKQHYEALIIAKETYYSAEELMHDMDYQDALEKLGYPRTDRELRIKR